MKPGKKGNHREALEHVLERLNGDPTYMAQVPPEQIVAFNENRRVFGEAARPIYDALRALELDFDLSDLKTIELDALKVPSVQDCLANGALGTDHRPVTDVILERMGKGARSKRLQRIFLDVLLRGVSRPGWTERHRESCGMIAAANLERKKLYPEIAAEVVKVTTSVPFWSVAGMLARALIKADEAVLSLEQIESLAQHNESGLAVVKYILKRQRIDAIHILKQLGDSPDKYVSRDSTKAMSKLRGQD